jgi:hypothetical protein
MALTKVVAKQTGPEETYRIFECADCGHMHWQMVWG